MNQVILTAKLVEISALRYTPAGIPALDMKLSHEISEPSSTDATFSAHAVAFSLVAQSLAKQALGSELKISGFLKHAGKSQKVMIQVEHFEPSI